MGADFVTMILPGETSRNNVKVAFEGAQAFDRHHNGHSYSGGFGMCPGLSFATKTFESEEAACCWLEDNAEKWENAIAVTFKEDDQPAKWMIGAWCSS